MYTGLAGHGHVMYSHRPNDGLSGGNDKPNPNHNPNPYPNSSRDPSLPTAPYPPNPRPAPSAAFPSNLYPRQKPNPNPNPPRGPYPENPNYAQGRAYPPHPEHSQSSTYVEAPAGASRSGYDPATLKYCPEDIVFCVDTDAEIEFEMRGVARVTRLDAIRQMLLLFVHAKLQMDPRHRFAIMTLSSRPAWLLRTFTSDVAAISTAVRSITSTGPSDRVDLAPLFRVLATEARASMASGRALRMVMIYNRSNVIPVVSQPSSEPQGQRPPLTADVVYIHEKPSEHNRPQAVYDVLVNALEAISERESYIYETSSGLARVLFRTMCALLAHPLQRCEQDSCDVPKDITWSSHQSAPTVTVVVPANQSAPPNPPTRKSSSYNVTDDPHSPYSLHSG